MAKLVICVTYLVKIVDIQLKDFSVVIAAPTFMLNRGHTFLGCVVTDLFNILISMCVIPDKVKHFNCKYLSEWTLRNSENSLLSQPHWQLFS